MALSWQGRHAKSEGIDDLSLSLEEETAPTDRVTSAKTFLLGAVNKAQQSMKLAYELKNQDLTAHNSALVRKVSELQAQIQQEHVRHRHEVQATMDTSRAAMKMLREKQAKIEVEMPILHQRLRDQKELFREDQLRITQEYFEELTRRPGKS